ncbi:DUF711 family protein, partial [Siminovitchia fortis]|uniref:DUF711 family protein n=1 Tax=Siminovitchia fortis TaxID=254758 RepID=UPI0036F1E71B
MTPYPAPFKSLPQQLQKQYPIPILNNPISLTPIPQILPNPTKHHPLQLPKTLHTPPNTLPIHFIPPYSPLLHNPITKPHQTLLHPLPHPLTLTHPLSSS